MTKQNTPESPLDQFNAEQRQAASDGFSLPVIEAMPAYNLSVLFWRMV